MTAPASTLDTTPDGSAPMVRLAQTRAIPAGWRTIGSREFTEHLLSIRFLVLLLVLGLAGLLAIYAVAGTFRDIASAIARQPTITGQQIPVFTLLFTTSPEIPGITGQSFPSFAGLVALLGPILGIAFGFDAISSERSEGTLPRLVSQPIHRDDVVNGKFVAGLAIIAMILGAVILMLAGVGIVRLGVVPDGDAALRLVSWFLVATLYVAFWLALATLASVVFRRAATAALVVIAFWLVLTFFGNQIVSTVANVLRPVSASPTASEVLANARMISDLRLLNPITLFQQMTAALLDPTVQSFDIAALAQTDRTRAAVTILPFGQSLLLIWPQVVLLVAGTVVSFVAGYIAFMRQEIRA
ncbi:MAG: ABC transporter permease [Chloroflexi bacterium]|nr:ABC transporter permease [Chloroflexota bacterium]